MTKTLFFFLIFSFLAILKEFPLLALPIPSFYQGMPYKDAREKMLELGWQAREVNDSLNCEFIREICNQYPEVEDCSGTGMGFCLFIFTDSQGKRFRITTAGRDPLTVVNWENESVQNTISPTSFVTPSRNISCALVVPNQEALRCEIHSGLNPMPPQPTSYDCQFDWGAGFLLPQSDSPKILCISDTIGGTNYTLPYGETWMKSGFKCHSQRRGLTCTNATGQGFFLSRESWKVF